jgi:hypothetical protein
MRLQLEQAEDALAERERTIAALRAEVAVGGRTAAQLRGMAEEAARGQREAEQAMAAQVSQPLNPLNRQKRPAPLR